MTMTEPAAYGDESIRRAQVAIPMYLIGVCITKMPEATMRHMLLPMKYERDAKLHWSSLRIGEKIRVADTLMELHEMQQTQFIIACGAPLSPAGRHEEHARRKCLECLLPALEMRYGIRRLILENRSANQDERELQFVNQLRRKHWLASTDFRVGHRRGPEDARLWLADQLLGAYGDYQELQADPDSANATQRFHQALERLMKTIDVLHCAI